MKKIIIIFSLLMSICILSTTFADNVSNLRGHYASKGVDVTNNQLKNLEKICLSQGVKSSSCYSFLVKSTFAELKLKIRTLGLSCRPVVGCSHDSDCRTQLRPACFPECDQSIIPGKKFCGP